MARVGSVVSRILTVMSLSSGFPLLRPPGAVPRKARLPLLGAALALAAGYYWFPVRRWMGRWGATPDERARVMPGDAVIANPTHSYTMAVTVNALPADIWPWLMQIGYRRGGLYSYDWLDRLFGFLDRPSATRILPEFQQLAVGDKILWMRPSRIVPRQELTVAVLEPLRALALAYQGMGMEWVWQFGLYPLDSDRTRLVSHSTERVPNTIAARVGMLIMEPAAFIMTRRMLLNLKERAEALRASAQSPAPGTAVSGATIARAL